MKISVAAAQRFSESLLRVYAAADVDAVRAAVNAGEAELASDMWLVGLLHGHGEHRRQQLAQHAQTPAGPMANLTRREFEVLQRIALGETDAAIGRALQISPKTASKHVENILRKLGVETRTAAAVAMHSRSPFGDGKPP